MGHTNTVLVLGLTLVSVLIYDSHGFSCITCNNLPLENDSTDCVERVEKCLPGVQACSSVVFKDEKGVIHRRKFCTASGTPMYQQLVEFPGSSMCQNIESSLNTEPVLFSTQDDNVPVVNMIAPQSFQLPPLDNPLPQSHPIIPPVTKQGKLLVPSPRVPSESTLSSPQNRTSLGGNNNAETGFPSSSSSFPVPPVKSSFWFGHKINPVSPQAPPLEPNGFLERNNRHLLLNKARGLVKYKHDSSQGASIHLRRNRQATHQVDISVPPQPPSPPSGVLPPGMSPHRPASTSKHISTLICVCTKEKCNAGDYPETITNILMQNIDKPFPKKDNALVDL